MKLLRKISDQLIDIAKIEYYPKMEGRQMIMVLAPNK